ncbi:phenylalanine--tRNA ligase subunit alpha [Candidatus Uhrbacteria bacterium]|jgi:phenylalanyl-tRNA synthetase alpha chain|nr:phenylalanine--tRNA ligase subunit alpha [Candidatus Uhrbacteria bacterium]
MKNDLEELKNDFLKLVKEVGDRAQLEELKNEFLGRKGKMKGLMKDMASLANEERKVIGAFANEIKESIESVFGEHEERFAAEEESTRAEREWVDISEPGRFEGAGHLHPVSQAIGEITDIFARVGFTAVRAPEIDWDYYAFESLNLPKDHPARDDWETFFVDAPEGKKGKIVLTPHTSNSQVRTMETQEPPIRMINIGRCYRRQIDITHVPMFHQFEGLMIDKGVSVTHLKGVLDYFAKTYFGPDRRTRLRPHHFRFTEPSFEVDISCGACGGEEHENCRVCKAGWLELGGAGMVHPNVIKAGGLDPDVYSGFAFGWGVERTLMMRSGIKIGDIRTLYKNDLRFVKQF